MKSRTTVFGALLLCSGIVVGSKPMEIGDASHQRDLFLIDAAWEHVFEWSKQKSDRIVFSHGSMNLNVLREFEANKTFLINENNLVMVSASKHTILGQEIHKHPRAIAVFPTESFYDFVLIQPESNEDRDALAATAHEDLGACGAVISIQLDESITALGAAISPVYATTVKLPTAATLADGISTANITTNDKALEALGTRYHAGPNAAVAVAKVKSMWQTYLPSGATLTEFSNSGSSTSQNNVVLTIPGTTDDATTVIVGAHLDSINRLDQTTAPGADDDASGIATLTEMIRNIHDSGATFQRRVEFHAYAAEEAGLIGSHQMAKSYAAAGTKVAGMLQIDMNGYAKSENANKIFLVTTDTSAVLRRGLKDLLALYLGGNYAEMSLSAGTSDHQSWTNAGFHAVFPFEHPQNYNRAIHSSGDTSSLLDFSLAQRFGKLSTLWLSHTAGLNAASTEYATGINSLAATSNDVKISEAVGSQGGSRLSVAVPQAATNVISCTVSSASAAGCSNNPAEYTLARSNGEKIFFASNSDITLVDGEFHRVTAYDTNGLAIAQRTIQFKKK